MRRWRRHWPRRCRPLSQSVRHRRMVPSSEPDAYVSPSGAKRTVCTGPWWPAAWAALHVRLCMPSMQFDGAEALGESARMKGFAKADVKHCYSTKRLCC